MERTSVKIAIAALFAFAAVFTQAQTCTTPEATLISPTPGSVLPSGADTFSWCNASADYFVIVESVPGAHDIFYNFTGGAGGGAGQTFITLGPACAPVPPIQCIPPDGETIFMTLQTVKAKTILGTHNYTFTAAGGSSTSSVWNGGAGLWSSAAKWTGGMPSGASNTFIDKGNALASAVTLDVNGAAGNLTIDADDSLAINDAKILTVSGTTISNAGSILINSAGNQTGLSLGAGKSVSLGGGGKVTLSETINNGSAFLSGGAGAILTNADNTIQGMGAIGEGSGLVLINQAKGSILANQKFPLTLNGVGGVNNAGMMKAMAAHSLTISSPLTNSGTIQTLGAGSNVQITGSVSNTGKLWPGTGGVINITGPFSNFSSGTSTLTGGTYQVNGTLQFPGANVIKNAATITLSGTASKITDQLAQNGLRNLASNLAAGSITLQSGRLLSVPGAFTNAGKVLISVGTGFGTATGYTQTAGRTTVDGSLSAPGGMKINAGMLFGKGTIQSTVTSSGSVTPGDSAATAGQLSITGTYSQSAIGILNISIGGLTVGTQYDRLAVTNGVSLNGKLVLKRINNFVPAIGSSFTIVTGSAVTGTFPTVTGLSINAGEHFQVNYGPTSVTVTVVSGP